MYEHLPNRQIACLDIRSFYASCAAIIEGLDVMETPIAVIGNKEHKGGIVLAASPPLKEKFGIQTGNRLCVCIFFGVKLIILDLSMVILILLEKGKVIRGKLV